MKGVLLLHEQKRVVMLLHEQKRVVMLLHEQRSTIRDRAGGRA